MKKIIYMCVVLTLLLLILATPISASVGYNTESGHGDLTLYSRNLTRSAFYTIGDDTRPLPNGNVLNIDYDTTSGKVVESSTDSTFYTVDIYPLNDDVYNPRFESVLGLFPDDLIIYTEYYNNTALHISANANGFYTQQEPNLNGYYVYSRYYSRIAYKGIAYVHTVYGERWTLDLSTIPMDDYVTWSPYGQDSLLNRAFIWENTAGITYGADSILNTDTIPTQYADLYYIPSVTELINMYISNHTNNTGNDVGLNLNATDAIYLQDASLTLSTDCGLVIAREYVDYYPDSTYIFDSFDETYNAEDITHAVGTAFDTEFVFGLSLTQIAYVVFGVIAFGYILKAIGGG